MKKNIFILSMICLVFSSSSHAQTYNIVSTYSGTTTSGLVNGTLAQARFYHPYSLCTDPATGDVYVTDTYNNCIRKISGGMVTTLAGNGSLGDVDGQGANARFNHVAGMCFYNGDVYVTDDGNHKIKKIDTNGNVTTIAGNGTQAYLDGPALQAEFNNPFDITVNSSGDLIVADFFNHCIRKISNGIVSTIAGVGGVSGDQTGAAATAKFNCPRSICFDAMGNLYIADMTNNKIKVLTTNGMVNFVAGSGAAGSQDGTGVGATFNSPLGVKMDMYGNVVIADGTSNKIRRTTPAGVVNTIAGTGTSGYLDGNVNAAEFYIPAGLGLINGKIYIVDVFNNCIRYLDKSDVGVNEISNAKPLSIFPNPTSDNLLITDTSVGNDHLSRIQIFSAEGKLIKDLNVENSPAEIKIDVADLPVGIYFITAISEEQKKYSTKFVKE